MQSSQEQHPQQQLQELLLQCKLIEASQGNVNDSNITCCMWHFGVGWALPFSPPGTFL